MYMITLILNKSLIHDLFNTSNCVTTLTGILFEITFQNTFTLPSDNKDVNFSPTDVIDIEYSFIPTYDVLNSRKYLNTWTEIL